MISGSPAAGGPAGVGAGGADPSSPPSSTVAAGRGGEPSTGAAVPGPGTTAAPAAPAAGPDGSCGQDGPAALGTSGATDSDSGAGMASPSRVEASWLLCGLMPVTTWRGHRY